MLSTLARWTTARPRLVLILTLLTLVAFAVVGRGVGDRLRNGGITDPTSQSAAAARILDARFPVSRPNLTLLVHSTRSVDDPAIAAETAHLGARLARETGVVGVTSYWQTRAPGLRGRDGRSALILARIEGDETDTDHVYDRIAPVFRGRHGNLDVELGGAVAQRHEAQSTIRSDLRHAELIALPITLAILVLVFGSAVAALLPLIVGIIAIVGTNAVLRAVTGVTDVSIFAQNLTTALGLGLAVDYALLIVRRFREELGAGAAPRAAVATTLRTAGRTVSLSALTVAVSLGSMVIFPLYFLRSFAYAGIAVVALAAAAALIVLPAALVLLGPGLNAFDVRRVFRRRAARPRTEPGNAWRALAQAVMRRAPIVAISVIALLIALGAPFRSVQFGASDHRQLPASAEPRVVAETIRNDFAINATSGIDVVATRGLPSNPLSTKLSRLSDVDQVDSAEGVFQRGRRIAGPRRADSARRSDRYEQLTVLPRRGVEPASARGQDLVRAIRAVASPSHALVGGQTAELIDAKSAIGSRLPLAAAIIALATLLVVFLVTGSILIPIQALLANGLSLTAMLGAVVWVFQDGHLSRLLGFTPTGLIETSLPVLMFCIAFGLSMDYGLFVLSRIREERDRLGDARAAIVIGMERTGGVVTAAATILAVVMIAIGTSQITNTKMLGLGIALAVLVDAFVVRLLLIPALLSLGGRAAWWAPAPLRALDRRFGVREETGGRAEPLAEGGRA